MSVTIGDFIKLLTFKERAREGGGGGEGPGGCLRGIGGGGG